MPENIFSILIGVALGAYFVFAFSGPLIYLMGWRDGFRKGKDE